MKILEIISSKLSHYNKQISSNHQYKYWHHTSFNVINIKSTVVSHISSIISSIRFSNYDFRDEENKESQLEYRKSLCRNPPKWQKIP